MRRLCLLLMVALIAPFYAGKSSGVTGKETRDNVIHSFCTEGKTWNYIFFNADEEPGKERQPYSYVVRGDTVVGDNSYKKIYYQKDDTERLAFMIRESGHKVFKLYPNQEEFLFFDFGRSDVNQVHSWISCFDEGLITNWMIYAIDTVQVNDYVFRRYCCYQQYSETELETIENGEDIEKDYWVEGIGDARYGIETDGLEILPRLPGITEYFVSCYENDECIFTADDFTRPSYTSTEEYFPEGTKWTEIRLDTLKYDSWYSKVGDEWVPNFETIEYYVKGEYIDRYSGDGKDKFRCVYTNGPEWTDSLALMIQEEGDAEYVEQNSVMASVLAQLFDGKSYLLSPGMAYQFDWSVGKDIHYMDILSSNLTGWFSNPQTFGTIEEIKEGNFGGETPLKYVNLNGVRIIQSIGVTEWNDGECLFGPPNPYEALSMYEDYRADLYPERHYRSMLVHFERNGEVLYDVWPEKGTTSDIKSISKVKTPNVNTLYDLQGRKLQHAPQKGIYIQNGQKVIVK